MTASKPLRQRDFPQQLGNGPSTIARAGCLLLAIDNARHRLTGHVLDPVGLNAAGVAAGCFDGSSAFTEKLAEVAGLKCGPRVNLLPDMMALALRSYLGSGRLALLHVAHTPGTLNEDTRANHWILGHTIAGQTLAYDDSATGAMGGLVLSTLSAPSGWGDHRLYVVRAFRTLSKG